MITKLTSRKLAAALGGMVAVVLVAVLVGYAGLDVEFADKALLGIGSIALAAIGAQTMLDNIGGTR